MKKNRIADVIKNKREHFIAKFYILSDIEDNDHGSEYHLFFKANGKSRWEPSEKNYSNLQYIVLTNKEIRYFRTIYEEQYKTVVLNENGRIYTHKEIGFDKSGIVPLNNQITIFEQ